MTRFADHAAHVREGVLRTMATPARYLTVKAFCDLMGISRRTFQEWRAKQTAPKCLKLPNGELRISIAEYDRWVSRLEEAA
ncbi:excisionase [Amycolatopsis dongchuanensis]|uniref:Helix-turn-helix domain-containing protein n=1 Tax=Amycolatopsis dongchuanensis TaxID=1070866 RepID=A0ABP9QG02_9PSEU